MSSNPIRLNAKKRASKLRMVVHGRLPPSDPGAAREVGEIALRVAALDQAQRACLRGFLTRLEGLAGRRLGGLSFEGPDKAFDRHQPRLIELWEEGQQPEGVGSSLGARLAHHGEQLCMLPVKN